MNFFVHVLKQGILPLEKLPEWATESVSSVQTYDMYSKTSQFERANTEKLHHSSLSRASYTPRYLNNQQIDDEINAIINDSQNLNSTTPDEQNINSTSSEFNLESRFLRLFESNNIPVSLNSEPSNSQNPSTLSTIDKFQKLMGSKIVSGSASNENKLSDRSETSKAPITSTQANNEDTSTVTQQSEVSGQKQILSKLMGLLNNVHVSDQMEKSKTEQVPQTSDLSKSSEKEKSSFSSSENYSFQGAIPTSVFFKNFKGKPKDIINLASSAVPTQILPTTAYLESQKPTANGNLDITNEQTVESLSPLFGTDETRPVVSDAIQETAPGINLVYSKPATNTKARNGRDSAASSKTTADKNINSEKSRHASRAHKSQGKDTQGSNFSDLSNADSTPTFSKTKGKDTYKPNDDFASLTSENTLETLEIKQGNGLTLLQDQSIVSKSVSEKDDSVHVKTSVTMGSFKNLGITVIPSRPLYKTQGSLESRSSVEPETENKDGIYSENQNESSIKNPENAETQTENRTSEPNQNIQIQEGNILSNAENTQPNFEQNFNAMSQFMIPGSGPNHLFAQNGMLFFLGPNGIPYPAPFPPDQLGFINPQMNPEQHPDFQVPQFSSFTPAQNPGFIPAEQGYDLSGAPHIYLQNMPVAIGTQSQLSSKDNQISDENKQDTNLLHHQNVSMDVLEANKKETSVEISQQQSAISPKNMSESNSINPKQNQGYYSGDPHQGSPSFFGPMNPPFDPRLNSNLSAAFMGFNYSPELFFNKDGIQSGIPYNPEVEGNMLPQQTEQSEPMASSSSIHSIKNGTMPMVNNNIMPPYGFPFQVPYPNMAPQGIALFGPPMMSPGNLNPANFVQGGYFMPNGDFMPQFQANPNGEIDGNTFANGQPFSMAFSTPEIDANSNLKQPSRHDPSVVPNVNEQGSPLKAASGNN
ncbi:hypothetical protein BB560_004251 [Smittium megazygosporum]|uniref:Uncharacterized protein n=1 Tax=Smittium megazygosporum TaxID=133381 RepID=A0A2T9Z9U4_9FUNG|nr:hypothetical protein BB560_004251 [Smittium megazygosporum]